MNHRDVLFFAGLAFGTAGFLVCLGLRLPYWTIIALGWLLSLVVGHRLAFHLPSALTRQLEANYVRRDGTFSHRRKARERWAQGGLRTSMASVLFGICLFTATLVWLISATWAPLNIGARVVGDSLDGESSMVEVRKQANLRLEKWYQRSNLPGDYDGYKRKLKLMLPVFLAFSLLWFGAMSMIVKSFYLYLLRGYRNEMRDRAEQYFLLDLRRVEAVSNSPPESMCESARSADVVHR